MRAFIEQFPETCRPFIIDWKPISVFKSLSDFADKRLAKPFRFANISEGILDLILPLLVGHETRMLADLSALLSASAQEGQDG